ncbi:type VI secretion system Vgr family protein [Azonexus caeni]|uniref:type VI secretion system Vgr family protein n=1 Tax=Azonexus caeni TaxID=266126 RepID=UPI003A8A0D7B
MSIDLVRNLFSSDTRLYALSWRDEGMPQLEVECWWGRESLSGGFEYVIDLVAPDARLGQSRFLGKALALEVRLADGSTFKRHGYVRWAATLDADGGFGRYRLIVIPWLWLTSRGRHHRVFQERSVVDIVDTVFADYADVAAWQWADEVAGFLADTRPRSYCVQYNESDYQFVSRLLAEEGLGWRIEADDAAPGGHRLTIFADSRLLPQDPISASGLRYHRSDSQEAQDAILAFGEHRRLLAAKTTLLSHDYKAKRTIAASVPTAQPIGGPHAPLLENYDDAGPYAFASLAEAERYGRLTMEAHEARYLTWLGRGTVRSLAAGTWIAIGDLPRTGDHRYLVCEVSHAGINNLTAAAMARLAERLRLPQNLGQDDPLSGGDAVEPIAAPTRVPAELLELARERGYGNSFTGLHADLPWRPALTDDTGLRLNPRPTAPGPMTATVVGPNGEQSPNGVEEIWCDRYGRIKIRFPWQQAERPDDRDSCWMRVLQRQAGPGMGWQWLPRIGQEVLIDFLNGDMDRPYVLGALYNGKGAGGVPATPGGRPGESDASVFDPATDHRPAGQGNLAGGNSPAWHGGASHSHRHPAALGGFKSKEFGGQGFNQLVLDDSDRQQRIQLKSTQHSSELNLGHLIHQADNYRGSFRGTGVELRTDAWGALRGGRGVLMSTWPLATPGTPAGDFAPGMALLRQADTLARSLSQAAKTHRTVELASAIGSTGAGQSAIDDQAAPIKALYTVASGMVDAKDENQASADAQAKSTTADTDKRPHPTDPAILQAARANFAHIAGQNLQYANDETTTFESGEDSNLAIAGKARIHTGQAIGLVAGAIRPGEGNTGIKLIAAKDDIDLQAQSDEMKFQAKQDLRIVSANAHVDFAAAKKIHLAVKGGASITIDGGITVQCPGTITVHASKKKFSGPVRENYALPRFSSNPFVNTLPRFDIKLTDIPGPDGAALANTPWRIVSARDEMGALVQSTCMMSGRSDSAGKVALTADQEKQLAEAYLSGRGVWVLFEGQIKRLDVTKERQSWTDQQKLEYALDSLGFADSFGLTAGEDSLRYAAPLARSELGQAVGAVFEKFKKGV